MSGVRSAHGSIASRTTPPRRCASAGGIGMRLVASTTSTSRRIRPDVGQAINEERARADYLELVHQLKPIGSTDRVAVSGRMDAAAIGDIVGLSATNIATKIHRLKKVLAQQFHGGPTMSEPVDDAARRTWQSQPRVRVAERGGNDGGAAIARPAPASAPVPGIRRLSSCRAGWRCWCGCRTCGS